MNEYDWTQAGPLYTIHISSDPAPAAIGAGSPVWFFLAAGLLLLLLAGGKS